MKCDTSLADRMKSSPCAGEHSGHYLICFSLIDKITHLLSTQPRNVSRGAMGMSSSPIFSLTPDVKCMAVIHHEHIAITLQGGPASLLITEYPIAVSRRVLHSYCTVDKRQTCSLGMHSRVNNSLFSFLFFPLQSLFSAWKQQLCLSKSIHK